MQEYSTKDLQFLLIHEGIHIKRFDSYKKLLLLVVQCLHWFNPIIKLLAHHVNNYFEYTFTDESKTIIKDTVLLYGDIPDESIVSTDSFQSVFKFNNYSQDDSTPPPEKVYISINGSAPLPI